MTKFRTMLFTSLAAGVLLSLSSVTANAQHPNPSAQLVAQARSQGTCSDPWITIAIWDVFASTRQPQGVGRFGDCDPQRYNNGSWSSYAELYQGVKTAFDNLTSSGVTTTLAPLGGGQAKITTNAGGGFLATQTVRLIGHDGASLIGMDGSTIVASGGGNFSGKAITDGNERRIKLGKSVLIIKKK
jgi:hypothetical protein